MRNEYVTVDGANCRLLTAGEGEDVVLLVHGLGTTADRWIKTIPALAGQTRVIAPDLWACGMSDDFRFEDSPQQAHVRQLAAVLDTCSARNCIAVGSSYGALLVALLHFARPEQVAGLVLVGSGSALNPPEDQTRIWTATRENFRRFKDDMTLESCRERLARTLYQKQALPPEVVYSQFLCDGRPGRAEATERMFEGLLAYAGQKALTIRHRLKDISVPCLVLSGQDDVRASFAHASDAVEQMPQGRLFAFAECGHAPMLEQPETFNAELLAFVGGL